MFRNFSQKASRFLTSDAVLKAYLFSLPFCASGTLILHQSDSIQGRYLQYLAYGISILNVSFCWIFLYLERNSQWRIILQNAKNNFIYIAFLAATVTTFVSKAFLDIGMLNMETFARMSGFFFVGITAIVVLPLLISGKQTNHCSWFFLSTALVMALLSSVELWSIGVLSISSMGGGSLGLPGVLTNPPPLLTFFHPNALGSLNFIAFCFVIFLFLQTDIFMRRVLYCVLLLILTAGLWMTSFRTAYVLMIVFPLGFFWCNHTFRIRDVCVITMSCILLGISLLTLHPVTLDYPLFNRSHLWIAGVRAIMENPLLGVGTHRNDFNHFLDTVVSGVTSTHNFFIDVLMAHGVVPGFLIIYFISRTVYHVWVKSSVCPNIHNPPLAMTTLMCVAIMQMEPPGVFGASMVALIMSILFGLANLDVRHGKDETRVIQKAP